MDIEQIDELLQRYTTAEHRVGANLHDLEMNSAYQILTTEDPTGITGQQVGRALDSGTAMWGLFLALQSTLEQARKLRGSAKRLSGAQRSDLAEVLTGPSVHVHDDPLAPERSAPIEAVLSEIRSRYETVRSAVVAIEHTLVTLLPRLDAAEQTLARATADAASLGLDDARIVDATRRLSSLRDRGTSDPLAIRSSSIDEVEALVRSVANDVTGTRRSRDQLHGDLAVAVQLVSEIRTLRAAAEQHRHEAVSRLANPIGLVRVPSAAAIDAPHGVASTLVSITESGNSWQSVRRSLDEWNRKANALHRQLKRAVGSNRSGLDRRNELRGLLSGLRAKMTGLGLDRAPVLMEIADEAHNELFTAPTDLARAELLVRELGTQLHEASR